MKELVEVMAKALVEHPEEVIVTYPKCLFHSDFLSFVSLR